MAHTDDLIQKAETIAKNSEFFKVCITDTGYSEINSGQHLTFYTKSQVLAESENAINLRLFNNKLRHHLKDYHNNDNKNRERNILKIGGHYLAYIVWNPL